jgi:hypothetical protein
MPMSSAPFSLSVYIAIALNVALPGMLIDIETGWRIAFGKVAALDEKRPLILETCEDRSCSRLCFNLIVARRFPRGSVADE